MNYLNPVHSSAAVLDAGVASSYHTLTGQAQKIMFVTTGSIPFLISFDATGDLAALTTAMQRFSGVSPEIINVNHPTYVNILGEATGYVYIMEFV